MNTKLVIVALAIAGGAYWYTRKRGGNCAGVADWEPCGPSSKCLKGKCVEFVRCADDPNCRNIQADVTSKLDEPTWFSQLGESIGGLFEKGIDAVSNAASEKIEWSGPVTSTNDPRLGGDR